MIDTKELQKKKLRTLIIDGDVNSLREESRVVLNNPSLELVNTCKTGRAAVNVVKETQVDLIIMNPALPDANGFDIIASLPDAPVVIVISDRQDYAYYAYRIDAVDYRLKPFTQEILVACLERVYRRLAYNLTYGNASSNR